MRPPQGEILQNEYKLRVNRVMDFIQCHFGEDLNLDRLAEMACISKYHFHRIFKTIAGETVGDYIRRIRLQEASQKLAFYPHKSITEIALECGFSSSQNFTKMFKALRGFTPSQLRGNNNWGEFLDTLHGLKDRKKEDFSPREASVYDAFYSKWPLVLDRILNQPAHPNIEIKQMPDLHVAYSREIGKIKNPGVYEKLFQWAIPRGYVREGMLVLAVMWHDSLTPQDKWRIDNCITVPESAKADKWVSVQTIPGGMFAVRRCEAASEEQYEEVWMSFIFNRAIKSVYQPDIGPARPIYHSYCQPVEAHPLKHHVLDLYLPIKPLYE